ncbi:MAG: hypothetical protein H0U55_00575 [Rubrobacteraceae bacterium]|nr:hypothetical protein [Rubrobacteraceae bacterium]
MHEVGGSGLHRIVLAALWAIAVPAIVTTNAAIVAPTRSTTNLLLTRYSFRSTPGLPGHIHHKDHSRGVARW